MCERWRALVSEDHCTPKTCERLRAPGGNPGCKDEGIMLKEGRARLAALVEHVKALLETVCEGRESGGPRGLSGTGMAGPDMTECEAL